jgi:hypothetical protein
MTLVRDGMRINRAGPGGAGVILREENGLEAP